MNFSIEREKLLRPLQQVVGVVELVAEELLPLSLLRFYLIW